MRIGWWHGSPRVFPGPPEIQGAPPSSDSPMVALGVQVVYNNGNKVQSGFASKVEAVQFLEKLFSAE